MYDEMEYVNEAEYEDEFDTYNEYEDEFEEEDEFEFEDEYEDEMPFSNADELELAAELLSVDGEDELEYFLGKLIKKAVGGARRFFKSKVGRKLKRKLKGIVKHVLPKAAGALGGIVGGPVGNILISKARSLLGLELEGLSPEDQEFEVAKRLVRLAGTAAKKAARVSSRMPASTAVNKALKVAAKKHAPGITRSVKRKGSALLGMPARSGRWVRRGRTIILKGV